MDIFRWQPPAPQGSSFRALVSDVSLPDAIGLMVDVLLFEGLLALDMAPATAHIFSFLPAAGLCWGIKARLRPPTLASVFSRPRILAALLVALAAVFVRGGLLGTLIHLGSWPPQAAILPAAILAALVNAAGGAFYVFRSENRPNAPEAHWPIIALALIVYAVLLRLFYLGLPEILHEEGYYWNFAQHLALGYLDHPPMVGWIIWLFTSLLGNNEFAVRLGAFILWTVGACYSYALSRRMFGPAIGRNAVLLYAVLPMFFGVGFVMLPDSSLVVCWAAALYYLYRFLIDEAPGAVWGVGCFFGLGLISKYTIVLLAAAALVFVILDPRARKWLKSPRLYLAMVLAGVLFGPVILWNARHEWASFVFQGPRRVTGDFTFNLPELIGSVLVLITPAGLTAAVLAAFSKRAFTAAEPVVKRQSAERAHRLFMLLTGLPLFVFFVFSLFRQTKLNWTGPIWLGMLPYMARLMMPMGEGLRFKWPVFGHRPLRATIIFLVLFYGAALHYLALGLPGIPYPTNLLGLGCRDVAWQVEDMVDRIEAQSGHRPLVVGMDTDRINSWLAFYRGHGGGQGARETGGRHLFGMESGMYQFWFPPQAQRNQTLVLVGRKPKDLTDARVEAHIAQGGEVHELTARRKGWIVRRNYYRIVSGYHPDERADQKGSSD
jgi:dolichol-phosphate mannosyltransferase